MTAALAHAYPSVEAVAVWTVVVVGGALAFGAAVIAWARRGGR